MSCCHPSDKKAGRAETKNCCASDPKGVPQRRRSVEVEYLYLDLDVCERCKGTDQALREAVAEAARILGPTGVDVVLKLSHVETEEQARRLAFVSSPTIRIMGRDAAHGVKESVCEGCSTLGGCDINCRVWTWQGQEYAIPPRAMVLDAILRETYLHPEGVMAPVEPIHELPENLTRFFQGASRA